jgi:beta-lactamase regulating signal transducer with metallopeptidase domain
MTVESAAFSVLINLAEPAFRALALAVVAGVVLALLRLRHTSMKLCLWTVVLVAALVMPALVVVTPTLPLGIIPPGMATVLHRAAGEASTVPSRLGPVATQGNYKQSTVIEDLAAVPSSLTSSALVVPDTQAGVLASLSSSWAVWLLILYLVGAFVLLARAVIGWFAARRLERTAASVDDEAPCAIVDRLAKCAGVARAPRLYESAGCLVPITMGIVRPIVMLPSDWPQWSETTLEAVLIHELAHVARRDALTQRLSLLHRAVFWFSPLGWWLHRHLGQLAEYASDEAVLAGGVNQTTYAEALLGFFSALGRDHRGEWSGSSASNEYLAMAQGSEPRRRVQHIFAWRNGESRRLTLPIAVAIVLVAAPMVTVVAAIQPGRAVVELPMPPLLEQPSLRDWLQTVPTVSVPMEQQPVASPLVDQRPDPPKAQVDYSGTWRSVQDAAATQTGELGDEFIATQDATRLVIDVAGHHDVYALDGSESRNGAVVRPDGTRWQEMVAQVTFEGHFLVIASKRPTSAERAGGPTNGSQRHVVPHRDLVFTFLDPDLDFAARGGGKVHAILRARVVMSLNADGSLSVEETVSVTPAGTLIPQGTTTTRRVYRRVS